MNDDQIKSVAELLPQLYKSLITIEKDSEVLPKDLRFAHSLQNRLLRDFLEGSGSGNLLGDEYKRNILQRYKSLQSNPYVRDKGIVWLVLSREFLQMWTPYNSNFVNWLKAFIPPQARIYQSSDKSWALIRKEVDLSLVVSRLRKEYSSVCCAVIDVRDSQNQDIPRVCFL